MDIRTLLKVMVDQEASDMYLTVDSPPTYRIHGSTQPANTPPFTNEQLEALALALMRGQQRGEFEEKMEMNLALYYKELGRFRVNIFRQRGNVGLVFRHIKAEIQTVEDLRLPQIIKDISMTKRGLVLVVGATGSGKSTTLAAMIDHRNSIHQGHIVTVEDPIEFVHNHKKSLITQREVGFDTLSFQNALKNTLRQAPDVILIGEVRDTETMSTKKKAGSSRKPKPMRLVPRARFLPRRHHDEVSRKFSRAEQCLLGKKRIAPEGIVKDRLRQHYFE